MQATLTQAHRQAKRIFRAAQNGVSHTITDHGKPVAKIQPDYPVVTMSADEFRRLEIEEEELNRAINRAIAENRA